MSPWLSPFPFNDLIISYPPRNSKGWGEKSKSEVEVEGVERPALWNGRPCGTGDLVERASCPFALARVAGSVRTPPLVERASCPFRKEGGSVGHSSNGRDARSTRAPERARRPFHKNARSAKQQGLRLAPLPLSFGFRLRLTWRRELDEARVASQIRLFHS